MWATLICVEESYPDFLNEKKVIEKRNDDQLSPATGGKSEAQNSKQTDFQESAKLRASLYRKVQYQKQKLSAKKMKRERSRTGKVEPVSVYPASVEAALAYFSENGFPMSEGPTETGLGEAKRKLSRVFHPDRGGSHEESVELNKNCEIIERYLVQLRIKP
jgi:hypothetical protein